MQKLKCPNCDHEFLPKKEKCKCGDPLIRGYSPDCPAYGNPKKSEKKSFYSPGVLKTATVPLRKYQFLSDENSSLKVDILTLKNEIESLKSKKSEEEKCDHIFGMLSACTKCGELPKKSEDNMEGTQPKEWVNLPLKIAIDDNSALSFVCLKINVLIDAIAQLQERIEGEVRK